MSSAPDESSEEDVPEPEPDPDPDPEPDPDPDPESDPDPDPSAKDRRPRRAVPAVKSGYSSSKRWSGLRWRFG